MASPNHSIFHYFPMAKHTTSTSRSYNASPFSFLFQGFRFVGLMLAASLLIWAFWSFYTTVPNPTPSISDLEKGDDPSVKCDDHVEQVQNLAHDPPDHTFYDDPKLTYMIDSPIKNWDEKRIEWLKKHPSFVTGVENRILMVTGSQATPCKNPIGDYLLLKFFKNKVDYCRRHGIEIFYNNVLLQPKMWSFWAKTPIVKAAMLAHPEAEWIWWVDSDAAITDMDFNLPLDKYKDHNMVIHGWEHLIYEKKSWTSINAGVFLIRNCQWAMDFMDVWAKMGPQSPDYNKWGEILHTTFKDKIFKESDDQSGLVYLLLKQKEKWADKVYVESGYYFEGYWMEIVGTYENILEKYKEIEQKVPQLRRRHAEKVSETYAKVWEEYLKDAGYGRGSWRRPFITHFTGCQPCSGDHNQMYSGQTCFDAMQKALIFADNQVLKHYGYVHPDLLDPSTVAPLRFDYPA